MLVKHFQLDYYSADKGNPEAKPFSFWLTLEDEHGAMEAFYVPAKTMYFWDKLDFLRKGGVTELEPQYH